MRLYSGKNTLLHSRNTLHYMENITLRVPEEFLADIDAAADEHDTSRSEYIRDTLRLRDEHDEQIEELENELERVKAERDDLRNQLQATNRKQREVGELAEYVEREREMQYRRGVREQQKEEASLHTRVWWVLSGMPPIEEEK